MRARISCAAPPPTLFTSLARPSFSSRYIALHFATPRYIALRYMALHVATNMCGLTCSPLAALAELRCATICGRHRHLVTSRYIALHVS